MNAREHLIDVIRSVRNRWRLRLAMRGALVVVAGTLLALFLSASGLESFRFSATAIIAFRIISVAVFVGLLFYGLVWPLRRRVTDAQVAMYLEECDPTLEAAIISAVEATANGGSPDHSPRLVEKLVERAIEQCRAVERGSIVDRSAVKRHTVALAAIMAMAALFVALGPAYLRHGLSALLVISRSAEAASPYSIEVTPGSAKVPRGADQAIRAKLVGFSAKDAAVLMRTSPSAPFERVPLVPAAGTGNNAADGTFEGMLFHLEKQTDYYVESNGVISKTFTLAIVDLPTVKQLDLEYVFPSYTGLPPRKVDDGGDVAAIRGTEVRLHITPTMTAPSGRILLNDGASAPLTTQGDGSLTGSFRIDRQGFYRIELTGPHGEKVEASPQYTIDVIDDQAPAVHFTKPGRDTQATPVEELFLEARADDDYGVRSLQLFYSVNGGATKTINLFGGGKPLNEVSAGHTIYLEELGLKPGDFVSYYAKATDTDVVQGPKTSTSDIYFVQIRPFRKDYKAAQSQAMGGGGGGGGQQAVGELSRQQREIVAATFNIVRDKAKTKADKFRENVVFINLAQAKLREQVDELVGKLKARLGAVDPAFNKLAEVLPKASEEMKLAENDLKAVKPDSALSPEQRALKLLQEAEQQYELQVSMQNGGGGGGGGGGSQYAEDLADLFELELDKLANQYEMQQRAMQQSGDNQIDQLVEKLKELARRQQQEMERQRRLAQSGQSGGGNSGANQRALAEELEKAARQLEQLRRDEQRQELSEAMRRMQDAADAMRRAAANGSSDGGAQAQQALDRLREAQQKLERNQGGRGERDIQRALRQAEELAKEQKEVASDVNSLDQAGDGRQARAQQLAQRKDAMDAKVADLQQQLERLANETRRDEKDASRRLDEAAGSIRDKKIREMIRYSKATLQGSGSQYARGMEETIGTNLDALQKKIADASSAMGKASKQDAMSRAADKARDLTRGLESIDQRMRERSQNGRNPQGQQGRDQQGSQNGQQSQQNGQQSQPSGQQGQQGSQGSQNSQGSQGQDGQNANGAQNGGANGGYNNGSPNRGGNWGGDARNWGGYYGGYWNPDDIRQWRREYREWLNDADALRRQLQATGVSPRELEDIIRDLQKFDNDRLYTDPRSLEQLQAAALDKLKKFEFGLRRKVETGNDSLSLSGSDQVPDGFRQAIEEYYRSLARRSQLQPPR
jgi:hypothetical protein